MFKVSNRKKAFFYLHVSIILFGFTAILGKLIDLSPLMLVWWRVLITIVSLFFLVRIKKDVLTMAKKDILIYLAIGVIIGLHWLTFFGAIKSANASTALICLATTSFFTSIIEPLLLKSKINGFNILVGFAILPMMWLVSNGLGENHRMGMMLGLLSAFLASIFSVLNKKYVDKTTPMALTFVEMLGVFLCINGSMLFLPNQSQVFFPPNGLSWVYLIILSLICTSLAWVIILKALKVMSAFEITLAVNLEPVYGIILAALLLNEHKEMTTNFYLGALMISALVLIYPRLNKSK